MLVILYSPVTLSLLGPNIFLSTLFSDILSLCSFLFLTKINMFTFGFQNTMHVTILGSQVFLKTQTAPQQDVRETMT